MNDKITTIQELKQKIVDFTKNRNWEAENAKNLSMALCVEASELMEIFQWIHSDEVDDIIHNEAEFTHLKEEIADVFWYLIRICIHYNIDLSEALCEKEVKNAKKYPPLK